MPKVGVTARLMTEAIALITHPEISSPECDRREVLWYLLDSLANLVAGRGITQEEFDDVARGDVPAFVTLMRQLDDEMLRHLEIPARRV